MDTQLRPCKREVLSQVNVERQNKSRKINLSQNSKSIQFSIRNDSDKSINNTSTATSIHDLKTKYIQEIQEDMEDLDVVDIRKRELLRLLIEKQNTENKIDEELHEEEVLNQDDAKSVELSLAITAAKLQKMEKSRRSQFEKLLAEQKELRTNNWKLMYLLYQSQQENEALKMKLRKIYEREKRQKSSVYSRKKWNVIFEERRNEIIAKCIFILICSYILYHLAIDVAQRSNPDLIAVEAVEKPLPEYSLIKDP